LQFKVQQIGAGAYGETLRTISLNGNAEVGRAAFDAAVRCYPKEKWFLLWGSYIVAKYEPTTNSQVEQRDGHAVPRAL
jgi:hypothetical protein